MKLLILTILVLIVITCFGSREGFIDFGLSGYKKPVGRFSFVDTLQNIDVSTMTPVDEAISSNDIASIIRSIQVYVKDNYNVCLEPIQTVYINKYSPDIYNARVMFYNKTHRFATEIVATLNGPDTVADIRTQVPAQDVSGPVGFTDKSDTAAFTNSDELLKSVSPSATAMDAVVKATAEDTRAYNSM